MPKAGKTARPSPRQDSRARRLGKQPCSAPKPGRRRSGAAVVNVTPPMPAPKHAVPCAPLDGLPPVQGEVAPPAAPVFGESGVNNTHLLVTISPAANSQVNFITPPSVAVSSPTLGVAIVTATRSLKRLRLCTQCRTSVCASMKCNTLYKVIS